MPARHAQSPPLVVANARHSPSYGCACAPRSGAFGRAARARPKNSHTLSRYTTVELIVDRVPVVPRVERVVGVRVHYEEAALQGAVKANGAKWDKAAKLWRMPHRVAVKLGLQSRIVEK